MGSLTFWSISTGSVVRNLATLEASWSLFSFEFIIDEWMEYRLDE